MRDTDLLSVEPEETFEIPWALLSNWVIAFAVIETLLSVVSLCAAQETESGFWGAFILFNGFFIVIATIIGIMIWNDTHSN